MLQADPTRPPIALLSSRTLIRLSGDDVRPFLQGLVTQDLTHGPAAGATVFAALLTPQGKVLFDFFLRPIDDGFMLEVDAAAAPALLKRLTMYRLRAKVAFDLMPQLAVAVALGDAVADGPGEAVAFADPRLPALGRRMHGPADILAAAATVDARAWDAHRRALGVPEFGPDFVSEEVFLLDVNYDALNAVSYRKGCFVGQEVTSRMKRKGEIRKRTLIARTDGPPPPKGSPVMAGEITLGETMSAGADGVALAVIRIDKLANAGGGPSGVSIEGRPAELTHPAYLPA